MAEIHFDPADFDSMREFMDSAKKIIQSGMNRPKSIVAMALDESWKHYVGDVDINSLTLTTKKAITEMSKKFPGFKPLKESGKDAVAPAKGKGLPQGTAAGQVPAYKTGEFKELDSKNDLIKRKQKNTHTTTPEVSGTAKGLDGHGHSKMEAVTKQDPNLIENISRLTRHIRKSLNESLRAGYNINGLSLMVRKDGEYAVTPRRTSLAEAVADAEEVLLFHRPENVRMVVEYNTKAGMHGKKMLELLSMKSRSPIFYEGRSLFRFARNAEIFARELAESGHASKVADHNWGSCVVTESRNVASKVFKNLIG